MALDILLRIKPNTLDASLSKGIKLISTK